MSDEELVPSFILCVFCEGVLGGWLSSTNCPPFPLDLRVRVPSWEQEYGKSCDALATLFL